jgi:hypothetical protein
VCVAEADVSQFGKVLAGSSRRSSCSCSAGSDDGDACGCHDLVGGIIEEFVCPSSAISTPEGNLGSSGSGDGGACLRLSPPWGHRLGVDFAWGSVMEGLWPICRQFGNDDAVSGVWVAARAWLVGLGYVR